MNDKNENKQEQQEYDKRKLYLTRERHLIYIYKPLNNKTIRYNLKEKKLQKQNKEGEWCNVETQYTFFRGYSVYDLVVKEEKFKQLINTSKTINASCSSLSSFISRLNNALVYEGYISEGVRHNVRPIRDGWDRNHTISKELNYYDKNVIKFFKEVDFFVDRSFEDTYVNNSEFMIKTIQILRSLDLDNEQKKKTLGNIYQYSRLFNILVNDYNYDIKALIEYVVKYLKPFENLSFYKALNYLTDYYRMASMIGRKIKKYPKYLSSMHDIIMANYNAYKKEYDEELFYKMRKLEMQYEDKNFIVKIPDYPKDIVSEGTSLNHCVGSYVDMILKGATYIMFLRTTENPDDSLVTLELINDVIEQARGAYNRSLTNKEKEFLEKYAKVKGIKLKYN